jgi:hypothetical protein
MRIQDTEREFMLAFTCRGRKYFTLMLRTIHFKNISGTLHGFTSTCSHTWPVT